jgi:pyruvate dehydrogenase E2 component (dihydrolipoamide acetyltransferase)
MGMFDVDSFMAIINPPSSCTLAVASILPTPVTTPDRAIGVADILKLTVSADHRIVDGVLAANLLGEIKRLIEKPAELL